MPAGRYRSAVPTRKPTRLVGYARGEADIPAQTAALRAWCDARRYELPTIHTDPPSSDDVVRPGLIRALAEVRGRLAAGLVIARMSVLATDPVVQEQVRDAIVHAGGRLHPIDPEPSPERELVRHTLDVVAANRLQVSRLITRSGARQRTAGGAASYGWRVQDGRELPVPEEQQIIGAIVSWRDDGLSLQDIADRLNQAHIAGSRGGKWHRKTVAAVLHRARYLPNFTNRKEPTK